MYKYIDIYTYIHWGIAQAIESKLPIPPCTLLRTDPSESLYIKLRYCNSSLETKVSNNFFSFVLLNIDNTEQCDLMLFLT